MAAPAAWPGRRWRRAVHQYGWLMLDQSVFAITNLVLNVLFAHWLTPAQYGRFGVTFSGFILLSVLHWFVVLEPLLVESGRLRTDQTRAYIKTLGWAHVILAAAAAAISVAACVAGALLGRLETGLAIAAACGGGCCLLTLATARRLCLAFLSAAVSALVGGCYLMAATLTAWALHAAGLTTWLTLWVVMSGWSLACALAIFAMLLRQIPVGRPYRLGDLLRATSRYSMWGSLSAGFTWIRSDGIFMMLALSSGLPAVAQTRAIVMLNAPVPQLNSALMASWLVDFGRSAANIAGLQRIVRQRVAYYSLGGAAAVAVAWCLHGWITHLVYQGKYDAGAWLMPLFLAAYLLNGVEGMLTSAMKSSGILRDAYLPQILGSVAVGGLAVLLIPAGGPAAAAGAVCAGALLGVVAAAALFLRGCRRNV